MNSLSLMLYGINIINNFGVFLIITLLFSLLMVGLLFISVAFHNDCYADSLDTRKPYPTKWWFALPATIGLILTVLPSKDTMYAIAASEVGERVVKSETVQGLTSDATKALQAWLRKQIDGGKEK